MSYKSLVAAAAIIVATPAFAQGHGGGHGGPPGAGGSPAGGMSQGPMNASPTGIMNANPNSVLSTGTTTAPTSTMTTTTNTGTNASTNSQATVHSQGPAHASPTGIAHANENSVLARGAVAATTLPGLTTGLVVNNSGGTQVGTVTQVITGPNDTIRALVVTSTSGKTYTLLPSTLSISGNVVTTTSTSIAG